MRHHCKGLFATTALIATAGVAAADVSISGSAEMGLVGGDAATAVTQFHQDIEVTFKLSGATDNGLSFGAAIDLDEAGTSAAGGAGTNPAAHGGVAVFISGAMGTLTLGDTDGGFDWAMAEVPTGSGSIANNESSHDGWNGNSGLDGTHDGQILRYNHTVGGVGFAVSVELDDTSGATQGDAIIGLGVKYSLGDMGIGFGYQTGQDTGAAPGGDITVTGLSLAYSMGDISMGANFSQKDLSTDADEETHTAVGVSYSMDALTLGVNYGQYENKGYVAGADRAGYGFSAGYDLGGGAKALVGYETTSKHETNASENSTWSLGLSMSF